ncbi:MAG: hypothetical protein NT121_15320 [Chloroflexi bacterium]|nr:hypothetical protein [Chloroflexota bacterium]
MKRFAHKIALLFTVVLLLALALPISALADGGTGGNELTQTVNGYQVTLVLEKPAFVGENQIQILVKDGMNMPVSQADLEVSVVEAEAEHVETEPTAETGTVSGKDTQPTAVAGTMSGMDAQPTTEVGTMSGMLAQPTAEIGTMTSTSEQPAGHDQMGMVALAAGHESGEYEGQISIESDGDQIIRVHLTVDGKLMEVDFPIHVAKSKTGTIVLSSFFAVDIVLIAAAVVMKRKSVSVDLSKKA